MQLKRVEWSVVFSIEPLQTSAHAKPASVSHEEQNETKSQKLIRIAKCMSYIARLIVSLGVLSCVCVCAVPLVLSGSHASCVFVLIHFT